MLKCRLCQKKECKELIDFGNQPICHRYVDRDKPEELHPLILGQCESCGLVQLINPIPVEKLIPRYEWIKYNEPEGHLDNLVDIITALPGITKESRICGISEKEDTTLARLKRRGFNQTWRVDMADDLAISEIGAGIESVQNCFNREQAISLQNKYDIPDVVIARHIIEHTHSTMEFMAALNRLVKPTGYVVFETPDFTQALESFNYAPIWEEHTLYFTEETFRNCFGFGAFSLYRFVNYPYTFENSLVGITQPQKDTRQLFPSKDTLEHEIQRAETYSLSLIRKKKSLRRYLSDYKKKKGRIAMFGTGHVACTFINLMELRDLIEFVVDDDSKKSGYLMPGSMLPIHAADSLIAEKISLCLSSLGSETEEKVINKNQTVIDQGGMFASIYPASKYALQV